MFFSLARSRNQPKGIRTKGRRVMGKISLAFCPLALLVTGLPVADPGEETPPVTVEASVDRSVITVGDPVAYKLTVKHDPKVKVSLPEFGVGLERFEIKDFRRITPRTKSNTTTGGIEYTITAYDVGEFKIPPLPVAYTTPDGRTDTLYAESLKITVNSVSPSKAGDILDIKPPVQPALNLKPVILGGAGVMILVLAPLAYLIYRKKRLSVGTGVQPTEPARPPYEVAIESLEAVKRNELLNHGLIKEYFSAISDTIRTYIEGRYAIPAMEQTTLEIISAFNGRDTMDQATLQLLKDLLNLADLVKFAKLQPPVTDCINYLEEAYRFLEMTRPPTEEERARADTGEAVAVAGDATP